MTLTFSPFPAGKSMSVQPPGSLNFWDYGAHHDGVTTDSDHLLTAMTDAVAQDKILWVPESTYLLAENVAIPSALEMLGGGPLTHFYATATYPLRIGGSDNVTLSNFTIQGNYTGTQGLIRMDGVNSTNIVLHHLTVYDSGYAGIHNENSHTITGIDIYDCTVYHCGTFGIHLNGATTALIERVDTYDFSNSIYPAHGFYINGADGLTMNYCTVNGPFDYTPNGIGGFQLVDTVNFTMDNCSAENCKVVGVNDGYGFIFVDECSGTLTNCSSPDTNYYGYYKYSMSDPSSVVIGGTNTGTILVA